MIATTGKTQWSVYPYRPSINGNFLNLDKTISRKIVIDPGYPFIHILKIDFADMTDQLNGLLAGIQSSPLPCSTGYWSGAGSCKINKSCSDVKEIMTRDDIPLYFGISLAESNTTFFRAKLDADHMLIDGSRVSPDIQPKTACYLPFFTQNFLTNQWILGSQIMSQYYMVFDASSGAESKKNQIGFGLKKGGAIPPGP